MIRRARSAVSLALALVGLAACGEPAGEPADAPVTPPADVTEPEAPALLEPEVPEEPKATPSGDAPAPPDRDALLAKQEEWRAKMNEHARGMLGSFESRVYAPPRDADLQFAEGVARVRTADAEATFRIAYDADREGEERLTVIGDEAAEALPKGSLQQVQRFADLTLSGPYRFVVQYQPPIQLLLTYSKDRKYKIVTAPPHKHDLQVSYRFDERELISHRGISVIPAAEITNYEWTFWRGRYLLSRYWVHGTGGTCDLEYDDRDTAGVTLLRRALLQKDDKSFDVVFDWERIEVR